MMGGSDGKNKRLHIGGSIQIIGNQKPNCSKDDLLSLSIDVMRAKTLPNSSVIKCLWSRLKYIYFLKFSKMQLSIFVS